MENNEKKQIPLKEGFWTVPSSPEEKPQLVGSKCESCGEIYFPKKEKGWCIHCYKMSLSDVKLNREGTLVTYSVVMQQPGGGFYKGKVPYAYGLLDLPEGVRIKTLFSVDDFDKLEIGKKMELVIEKLCDDDEGNEVVTFKFKPIN